MSHETVLAERVDQTDRVRDKDALDVLRLLRAIETDKLANRLRTLRSDELARFVTSEALELLLTLFGNEAAVGVEMAVRGAGDADDAVTIAGSFVALVEDLGANLA